MTREPVSSSAIKSIGYDENAQVVEIEILESGEVYQYFDVPLEDYSALVEASSIGTYYNTIFKRKFPSYKKIN